mmetsp:Transcript_16398/g.35691  ORF Transcript_16398/g.35691 Transcript_16398/m.35691 type:complete len:243 (-) Transcript_16398:40-768(-)
MTMKRFFLRRTMIWPSWTPSKPGRRWKMFPLARPRRRSRSSANSSRGSTTWMLGLCCCCCCCCCCCAVRAIAAALPSTLSTLPFTFTFTSWCCAVPVPVLVLVPRVASTVSMAPLPLSAGVLPIGCCAAMLLAAAETGGTSATAAAAAAATGSLTGCAAAAAAATAASVAACCSSILTATGAFAFAFTGAGWFIVRGFYILDRERRSIQIQIKSKSNQIKSELKTQCWYTDTRTSYCWNSEI